MRGHVQAVERDNEGNMWFLPLHHADAVKGIDMTTALGKRAALLRCDPFFTVVDKAGMMMSRGIPYLVDKDNNERAGFKELKQLFKHPNPLQSFASFLKEVEISLKVFGFCPIVLVRSFRGAIPKAMWIVPAELFHMQGTGKLYSQFEYQEVIQRTYISWGGREIDFDASELLLITDSRMIFPDNYSVDVEFRSVADGLSASVNNWICAMEASHTLIVHGGPKGIVYNDHIDEMGNVALTAKEEKALKDEFKQKYGLVGKEYPIVVSTKKLGWIPLDYNADQLKLHEEDVRCTEKISNAIGINPNIFTNAKFDNQESAKRAAYQDVIIPDSLKIAEAFTEALCPSGLSVKLDFSGVECLQADRQKEASTLSSLASALTGFVGNGILTPYEVRKELSKYIDIDPDIPIIQPTKEGGQEDE